MADPSITSTAAVSAQLRAQLATSVTGLKSAAQSSQELITQLQKTAAPVKATSITQTGRALNRSGNLPRGSIVDVSV